MTEKRVVKVTKRRTRKAVIPKLAGSPAMAGLESGIAQADGATVVDRENRRRLIAAEAYFFAERRGFTGGKEVEDWVAAERLVDSWLNRSLNS